MAGLRQFLLRLIHALRPPGVDDDVSREVASHLALLEDEYRRRGMTPSEAHTAARRALGGAERVRAAHRDARAFRWMDELRVDLRYAVRGLSRHRRSTAIAVLILAAAGTVNALILGVADGVLFRPLPYRDPSRIRTILMRSVPSGTRATLVRGDLLALLRAPNDDFSAVGAIDDGDRITITTPDGPRGVVTAAATPSYFEVLGIRPYRGRLFSEGDVASGHVALLSFSAWHEYFGGDEHVVGNTVTLGDASLQVVGILPPELFLPMIFNQKPAVFTASALPPPAANSGAFYPIVRLGPNVTVERAQARLNAITVAGLPIADTQKALPALDPLDSVLFKAGQPIMRMLAIGAFAFMVLACVNLASVFLVRSHGRARDVGLRLALGASRTRVVRPVLFEVVAITLAGTAAALVAGRAVFPVLLRQVPSIAYGNAPTGIDARVAIITIALGLLTALLFTFVPAWRATLRDAQSLIRTGAGHSSAPSWRLGRPLIALQVALTLVLVFGAMLTGRAFVALLQTPLGFSHQNVLRISLRPSPGMDPSAFDRTVVEALRASSLVAAVGSASSLPFDGSTGLMEAIRGFRGTKPATGIVHALPGYFEALSVPIVRGRAFVWGDLENDPDASVISETAARVLFGATDPIGGTFASEGGRTFHVVGVASNFLHSLGSEPIGEAFVIPAGPTGQTLVAKVRTKDDATRRELIRVVQRAATGGVAATWWSDPISNVTAFRNPRFQTVVLGTLGTVALIITAFGIVGVIGFLVVSRTRELAIRSAVGATPASLTRMVVCQGLVPVGAGLVVGLVAARWASRLAEAQLFKVNTKDLTTLALTMIVVVVTTVVAAYLPSRRAGRLNPADVLRID